MKCTLQEFCDDRFNSRRSSYIDLDHHDQKLIAFWFLKQSNLKQYKPCTRSIIKEGRVRRLHFPWMTFGLYQEIFMSGLYQETSPSGGVLVGFMHAKELDYSNIDFLNCLYMIPKYFHGRHAGFCPGTRALDLVYQGRLTPADAFWFTENNYSDGGAYLPPQMELPLPPVMVWAEEMATYNLLISFLSYSGLKKLPYNEVKKGEELVCTSVP